MTKLSIKERTTVEARIWQMLTWDGRERQLGHIEFLQETSLTHLLISGQFSISLERILTGVHVAQRQKYFSYHERLPISRPY